MKQIKLIIIALAIIFSAFESNAASPNAQQILQNAASALTGAGGVTASYTFKSGSYSETGEIYVKGKKYAILTNERNIWYNGTTMWTLVKDDKEVSISAPTSAEASAMNPYLLVSGYKTEFTAKLVKSSVKGTYNIMLTPKNKQSYIKSATLCVRSANYMPVRLDITDKSGTKSVITVTNVKTNVSVADSKFTFSSSAYPGYKVIDLR